MLGRKRWWSRPGFRESAIRAIQNLHVKKHKVLARIVENPASARFGEMVVLLGGSHHIFVHPEVPELVNLQEVRGMAKAYQVRQVLKIVERHGLRLEEKS